MAELFDHDAPENERVHVIDDVVLARDVPAVVPGLALVEVRV